MTKQKATEQNASTCDSPLEKGTLVRGNLFQVLELGTEMYRTRVRFHVLLVAIQDILV